MPARPFAAVALCTILASGAYALDPRKSLTQYSRTIWTQESGLPQDTIRAITQTPDGYLWLGTDEGVARYDGYEFVSFNNVNSDIPSNSVTSLAATPDGSLWIGTARGLARFKDGRFRNYTAKDGLPNSEILRLGVDRSGVLWVVAGVSVSRYQDGKFTNLTPGPLMPAAPVRAVCEDRQGNLLIAGFQGVARLSNGKFTQILPPQYLEGNIVSSLMVDRRGNIWLGGSLGLLEVSPAGAVRRYTAEDGITDPFVRALLEDRDGNIWAGGNGGLARLENGRFVGAGGSAGAPGIVYSLLEDREGDLWVGADSGLTRMCDNLFSVYGKSEGLPSDEPDAIFQDHAGRVWVGFHDSGLMELAGRGGSTRNAMGWAPPKCSPSARRARETCWSPRAWAWRAERRPVRSPCRRRSAGPPGRFRRDGGFGRAHLAGLHHRLERIARRTRAQRHPRRPTDCRRGG